VALAVTAWALAARDTDAGTAAAQTATQPTTEPGVTVTKTISVDATGSVKGKPDTATVQLGVEANRPTAAEAMEVVNAKAQALIGVLQEQGVEEADITTSQLSLWPQYDSSGTGRSVTSYTASNMVSAVVRDLGRAGGVIDQATKAAGEEARVHGISFSISDTTPYAAKARAEAVKRAKQQAEELAAAAGVKVGPVERIATASYDVSPPAMMARDSMAPMAAGMAAAPPVQPGTQEITARVTMVYELVP
jgi:uncharacterized protein YggE